jgi:hypothetical protein
MRHVGTNRATTGGGGTKCLYIVAGGNDNEWLCAQKPGQITCIEDQKGSIVREYLGDLLKSSRASVRT